MVDADARARETDPLANIACYRCGRCGHLRANCPSRMVPGGTPLPAAASARAPAAVPMHPPAEVFRRDPAEICPPTEGFLRAKENLVHKMPVWLWKRMQAWHQVAESRRERQWMSPGDITDSKRG